MLLARSSPSVHNSMGRFWLVIRQHTTFSEHYRPFPYSSVDPSSPSLSQKASSSFSSSSLFSTPLPSIKLNRECVPRKSSAGAGGDAGGAARREEEDGLDGSAQFNREVARELQKQLVLLFHDYAFAVEAWGLLLGQYTTQHNTTQHNTTQHNTCVSIRVFTFSMFYASAYISHCRY